MKMGKFLCRDSAVLMTVFTANVPPKHVCLWLEFAGYLSLHQFMKEVNLFLSVQLNQNLCVCRGNDVIQKSTSWQDVTNGDCDETRTLFIPNWNVQRRENRKTWSWQGGRLDSEQKKQRDGERHCAVITMRRKGNLSVRMKEEGIKCSKQPRKGMPGGKGRVNRK